MGCRPGDRLPHRAKLGCNIAVRPVGKALVAYRELAPREAGAPMAEPSKIRAFPARAAGPSGIGSATIAGSRCVPFGGIWAGRSVGSYIVLSRGVLDLDLSKHRAIGRGSPAGIGFFIATGLAPARPAVFPN